MTKQIDFPLAVDLDETLIKSDSLVEALVFLLFTRPWLLITALRMALKSRYSLKAFIAGLGIVDAGRLPLRDDLVSFLAAEKARGRELCLITATHQSIANAVATRLGLFSAVYGSADGVNLKGENKVTVLGRTYPDGFAYAGNHSSDVEVWRSAASIVLVNANDGTRTAAHALGKPIEREFAGQRATWLGWLRALRVHQWSKNLLLFVPFFLAHQYGDIGTLLRVMFGFLGLGLVASGSYLLNDLSDIDADRAHCTKSRRAIASGAIPAATAVVGAGVAIAAGLLVGLIGGGLPFALLQIAYLTFTLAYSFRLKRLAIIDVFVLGGLYTLRVYMGMVLISSAASPWLLAFSLFLFCSLSMAKRHVEIVRAAKQGLELIKGRGYVVDDAPLTLSFGVASSQAAVVIFFLYVANDAYPAAAYASPKWLWLIGLCIFMWTTRIWFLSNRGALDDDPVVFALRDLWSLCLGAIVALIFMMATFNRFL